MEKRNIIQRLSLELFKENYICNNCLGRQFGKLLCGYSNEERGFSIRTFLSMEMEQMEQNHNIINKKILENLNNDTKDKKCWVCQNIFNTLTNQIEKTINKLKNIEYSKFLVGTKLNGLLSENEEVVWEIIGTKYSETIKSEINREFGKKLQKITNKIVDLNDPDIIITLDLKQKDILISIKPLYIKGTYNKYMRGIPQTYFYCKVCNGKGCESCKYTGKKYNTSVGELIGNEFLKYTHGSNFIFHGCGREDIDALMLGNGRPFVLEIKDPMIRSINLYEIENIINKSNKEQIKISNLSLCNKKEIKSIKTAKPSKTYNVKIKFDKDINIDFISKQLVELMNTPIEQKTPYRVLHRRSDIIRTKNISNIKLLYLDNEVKEMKLTIKCDGGLYIKELISGDNGRTIPNLSLLLSSNCHVEELDVIDIGEISKI